MTVIVGIATYKRPEGLARLLKGINRLTFEGPRPDLGVIVIDNDAAGSAASVCRQVRGDSSVPIEYRIEPKRGIAYARNAALDSARDRADFVAFIDDDEVPTPRWMDELLAVQQTYDADVVAGPVVTEFVDGVPEWVVRGRFFERPRFPTGHRRTHAFTGNVLMRGSMLREVGLSFDPRLALTGGEDSHFFRRLGAAGKCIVWADEAVVIEMTPASRARVGWLLRRAFRSGSTMAFIELDLAQSLAAQAWRFAVVVAKGATWKMIGLVVLVGGLALGKHVAVRGLSYVAYGTGLLAGLLGARYQEYRHTQGR